MAAWEEIVRAAGDVYADDLMMGSPANDETGHWRDQIPKLQKDLASLEQQRAAFRPEPERVVGKYFLGEGAVPAGFTSLSRGRAGPSPRTSVMSQLSRCRTAATGARRHSG